MALRVEHFGLSWLVERQRGSDSATQTLFVTQRPAHVKPNPETRAERN